jgi:hypothetical protein
MDANDESNVAPTGKLIACELGPDLVRDLDRIKAFLGISNTTDSVRFLIRNFVRTVIDVKESPATGVAPATDATPESD